MRRGSRGRVRAGLKYNSIIQGGGTASRQAQGKVQHTEPPAGRRSRCVIADEDGRLQTALGSQTLFACGFGLRNYAAPVLSLTACRLPECRAAYQQGERERIHCAVGGVVEAPRARPRLDDSHHCWKAAVDGCQSTQDPALERGAEAADAHIAVDACRRGREVKRTRC